MKLYTNFHEIPRSEWYLYIEPWFPAFAQPSSTQHILAIGVFFYHCVFLEIFIYNILGPTDSNPLHPSHKHHKLTPSTKPTLAPENIPSHKSALGWSKISGHPVDGQLMAVILSQLFGMTLWFWRAVFVSLRWSNCFGQTCSNSNVTSGNLT